jgi:hypothetical protein
MKPTLPSGRANEQPVAGASGDTFMGSLRDLRDNRACFVWMLIDRRAVSQHKVSRSPFDLDGAAEALRFGAGGHLGKKVFVRTWDDSAAEAPKNKKELSELANRDNLTEFHDELRVLPYWTRAQLRKN